jgi:hypothetical protein
MRPDVSSVERAKPHAEPAPESRDVT